MKTFQSLLVVTLATAIGCATAPDEEVGTASADPADDPAAELAAARAFSEQWDPTFLQRDADAMTAMFTDDAVRLMADQPIQRGKAAIRAGFAADFEGATFEPTNPVDDLVVVGDWAWARGTYQDKRTDTATGEVSEDVGKWLTILRKTPEGWKYQVDSGNENELQETGEPLETVSLPAAEEKTSGDPADVAAVRAAIATWLTASEALDAEGLTTGFTADGIRMNDDAPSDVGRDAIRARWEATMPAAQESQLNFDVIEVSGDWAWARGHWGASFTDAEGAVSHQQGKWITICERTEDGWMTKVNLWNLDAPPAPLPEA